ncbi:restriction endonuclease subunit S [Paenibacillus gansuensis]|uniref:Restriction endonuclease subunit S n=1 Tax=Paenibacillus gansuensis TaxID=306542 RepID=A0ABW5P809_9BACL
MSKWEKVKLGEICDLDNGYAFKSSDYISNSNTINCRMSNIRPNATFDALYNAKYLPDNYSVKYSNYLLRDGDVIIAMTDMANDPKILGVPTVVETQGYNMLLNQRVGRLRFLKEVDGAYLKYALCQPQARSHFKRFAGGGLQINVGKKEILSVEIPLPPVETQKQIAKTLDTAAELLALRKQQLAELDNLIKSQFIEMFGDPVTNSLGWDTDLLEKYANVLTGHPFDSSKYSENGIKICGGLIIMPDRIAWEDAKYWSSSLGLEKYLLEENDIVLAMDRPWISSGFKIGQISRYDLPTLLIQRTARIRAKNMNQSFMNWMISSQRFLMHCNITETTVPHISIKDIKSFEILVPPLELQNQFAEIVTKINEQKALVKKAIYETQYLFDSLMSEYCE